jgi:transmembrane sensor
MAAALVGAISLSSLGLLGNEGRIETEAGEHRTIALADGSKIEINGASVIEIDKDRPRFARLETGEAMFHVVHHDDDPFVVETGDAKIVDLGTAFNVVRRDRRTSVAVSEGIVLYNPDRDKVRLVAGKGIEARDGDRQPPVVQDVDVASIGGWRSGLLVYNGTPLAVVAEDLKRTAGMQVSIAPEASDLSFRGALIIDKNRNRTIADLAALSGTRAERQGEGWILTR